jgi:TPR repeat
MVYLKLNMIKDAIADYDAALKLRPNLASSLYGRGIGKLRTGNAAEGNADVAAAKAIDAGIASEFAGYGIR